MAFVKTYVKVDQEDYKRLRDEADDIILSSDLQQLMMYQGQAEDIEHDWEQKVFNVPDVHRAAFYDDISKLKVLLMQKKNVNLQITDAPKVMQHKEYQDTVTDGYFLGTTPLMIASSQGHIRAVKILVRNGADVNIRDSIGMTAFAWACTTNNVSVCDFLLRNYALIDEKDDRCGMSPLLIASWLNQTKIVKILIKRGANVHSQNFKGQTAMHFAAWNYNRKMIKLLHAKGLSVNVKDNNGNTPLHAVVSDDSFQLCDDGTSSQTEALDLVKMFRLLKKHENEGVHVMVDIARRALRGTNSKVSCEEYFALKTIVDLGADVNRRNNDENTAFHILAQRLPAATLSRGFVISDEPALNQICLVQIVMLVKMGAVINSSNIDGKTPLELCEQSGKWVAVRILGKYTNPQKPFVEDWDSLHDVIWKSGMQYCERLTELEHAVDSMSDTVLGYNNRRFTALKHIQRASRHAFQSVRTCVVNMWE